MTARTHDLAAFSALTVIFLSQPERVLTLSTVILAVFANLIGGITPDIDQPTAPFWRNLPILRWFGGYFDNLVGGHRFITHSILGLALFGFLVHYLLVFFSPVMPHVDTGYVWWAYMIGMTSHLVMDTFTKEGVPWLLPIPVRLGFPPIKKFRVTTDKFVEKAIIFPGLAIFLLVFLYVNSQQVLTFLHHYLV